MSKRTLADAGAAFRQGRLAEVAELLDASVIDAAEGPEAADRLRFVRAHALVRSGNPRAALVALDAMDRSRQATRPVLKLSAVAALAVNDVERARRSLAQLIRSGDRDAIPTYQTLLIRHGLDALARRDAATAFEAFRTAHIPGVKDIATRFAAWLGLLAAGAAVGDRAAVVAAFAMFPEWARDRRANMLAARSAIAALDTASATGHLEALGHHEDAWPLWWSLCKALLGAARYKDVVELFGGERAGQPAAHAKAVLAVVAVALYALGRHRDAQQMIERVAIRVPDDGFVSRIAAFLAFAAGDLGRTELHLRRVTDESEPTMLLRWVVMFGRGRYEPIRDALTPEAVRAWPDGPERDTAVMMASLANLLLGSPSRAWALLRVAGDPARPGVNPAMRYLGGYLALVDREYDRAAELLGKSPLGALAHLESARTMADAGAYAGAHAELDLASGLGLDPAVIDTRNQIRLQQAQDAVRADDAVSAGELLARVRAEAPHLADRVFALTDYTAVRATLRTAKHGDPARVAEVMWDLYETVPPGASERQQSARRRDLSYLTGVMRLRALARGTPPQGIVASTIEALEASLDEDPSFAPAAAVLGTILQCAGDLQRALALFDVAYRGGLASPTIRAALADEYVHHGRLVDAKHIFFDLLAAKPADARAREHLSELLTREVAMLLRAPSRPAAPAPSMPKSALEAPDIPAAVDPFAGTDPRQRLLVLIHQVEAHCQSRSTDARGPLSELVRELKRVSLQGTSSELGDLERRALALLNGASS
jgi:tetratricopeptide (TPR) repeat protein